MTQANSTLRPTGIPVMGSMPWGTHVCVFYETKQDLVDTVLPFFKAGLDNNECCVWAVSAPVSVKIAEKAMRGAVRNFDQLVATGQIEILQGYEWYLRGKDFDAQRITGGWHQKLERALSSGFDGMRVSGNAFWFEANQWKNFIQYEEELDRSLDGRKLIVMCTYSLKESRAIEILDVVRAHNFTLARRRGEWELLETPELKQAKFEIKKLNGALDVLSNPFPRSQSLTARERSVLAHLVRGATSKEAGRRLAISPRTVEFHRANIIKKIGAKNLVDLVRKVAAGS